MANDIKISACLVVYNEEKNIRRCLDSLRSAVDEIIIVHDGECSDKTLEICQEYGAKIFTRPHVGVMEAHMVFAIKQTSGNWLLRIDADEFLSDELRREVRNLVEKAETEGISAYSLRWLDFFDNKFLESAKRKPVLFKKADFYWLSLPHWAWQTRGRLELSPYVLGHLCKLDSVIHWGNQKKYAAVQAEYILKDFGELDSFQAERADWEKVYSFSRRHAGCLFLPVFKSFKSFCEIIFQGLGLEEAKRQSIYNFHLGRYLYQKSKSLKNNL